MGVALGSAGRQRAVTRAGQFVGLALLAAAISPESAASQGTAEQQDACRPDVFRLCSSYIPNVDAIVACLRSKGPELNPVCRSVMFPAPPAAARPTVRKAKRKIKRS